MVSTIDEGLLQVADLDGGPLDGGRRRAEELPAGDRRDAVGHAVNLPALGPGWCHDVDCPGNLFGQPVVAERAVVADVHWLGDVGGDEVLMGRVHGLLAGRERDDEVCSRKSRSSHPFSVSRDAISRAAFGATSRVVSMSSTEMIWWPSAASRERSRLSRVESPCRLLCVLFYGSHTCVSYIEYTTVPT